MSVFDLCTETKLLKDGTIEIHCRRGLWAVSGTDETTVRREAKRYFEQYLGDGEYDDTLDRSRQTSASRASLDAKNFLRDNPQ